MGEGNSPLGPKVVTSLLEIVDAPKFHHVYFDNVFTSPNLLLQLREKGFKGTGTVRVNRLQGTSLKDTKQMEKMDRGSMDISSTSFLCAVRWVDNKVVTVLSNYSSHEPLQTCKHYDRKEKNRLNVDQPNLIHKYNKYMGGVDQLSGFLNNLRPCIGGRKWYWTQFINLCRLLQIASFLLYNKLHPELKLSQLEFLRSLVKQYVQKSLFKVNFSGSLQIL